MSTTSVPRLLRVREVAELTGLAEWRLYELLAQGDGPQAMRVGRTYRISEKALVDWIERQHEERESAEGS